MAIYTVLAPPVRGADARPDPAGIVFVKDGFCWPALFIAVPWMFYRRLWLVLLLYILTMGATAVLLRQSGAGDAGGFITILIHVLFALEANNLRRWTLERRGYNTVGIVEGRTLEEAEIRYFSRPDVAEVGDIMMPSVPATPPAPPTPPMVPPPFPRGPVQPSAEAGDVVGLFPAPATPRGSQT